MGSNSSFRIWDSLRLLGASLFVFTFTLGQVALLSWLFPKAPPWLLPPALLLSLFGAIAVAHVLFQKKLTFTRTEKEIQAERDKLEQLGLLVHQSFRALRAFQLEEFEDEGSQYFLELEDHSVFYLSGQFLYEYEPPTIGPVDSPARNLRFAATRKTAISLIFFVRGES